MSIIGLIWEQQPVVAIMEGEATCYRKRRGRTTPSIVAFKDDERFVGSSQKTSDNQSWKNHILHQEIYGYEI